MGTVFEVPMAKRKPHTPVAAETERRHTDPDYFIDIIGRSGLSGWLLVDVPTAGRNLESLATRFW
jgi:hypothetical protein